MKDSEWNETGIPLGYLITFRCYGTWLHGDQRGSIDEFNNKYDTPYLPPNKKWRKFNREILRHNPVKLSGKMRNSVETALREVCKVKGWQIHALNVRTNHIHVVVAIGDGSSKGALISFKANATRKMRKDNIWQMGHSPWAKNGSRRYLWNERSLEKAVDYVINGQGKDLPDF